MSCHSFFGGFFFGGGSASCCRCGGLVRRIRFACFRLLRDGLGCCIICRCGGVWQGFKNHNLLPRQLGGGLRTGTENVQPVPRDMLEEGSPGERAVAADDYSTVDNNQQGCEGK